jgi:hypothetical protein
MTRLLVVFLFRSIEKLAAVRNRNPNAAAANLRRVARACFLARVASPSI